MLDPFVSSVKFVVFTERREGHYKLSMAIVRESILGVPRLRLWNAERRPDS